MGWEEFEQMERQDLRERSEGRLRRALGRPLPGESVEYLDRIGDEDRLRAEQGLVAVVNRGGQISYERMDNLGRLDMTSRTTAEQVIVDWLKKRVESRKRDTEPPPIPPHLR